MTYEELQNIEDPMERVAAYDKWRMEGALARPRQSIGEFKEHLAKVFDKEDLHTRTEEQLLLLCKAAAHILRAKPGEFTYDVVMDEWKLWSE